MTIEEFSITVGESESGLFHWTLRMNKSACGSVTFNGIEESNKAARRVAIHKLLSEAYTPRVYT